MHTAYSRSSRQCFTGPARGSKQVAAGCPTEWRRARARACSMEYNLLRRQRKQYVHSYQINL